MLSTADQKYLIRTALFMGGYALVNIAAIFGAFDDIKPPGSWVFALVVSAPVVGHLWSLLAWMRDSDEFVRAVAAKRFIVATGITMALVSAWGFMEIYAKAPRFPLVMVLPVLWASWGLVSPFIRTSR
jgi:hypothetical protein